ncbi:hypothetical protein V8J82_04390 [Gymnodinialimonas sp. 2305UL16-5]|uniref:hypothetical protein n=1 Tax=Gymnodinialimonas mytili TaxID=3126503 RepID=UPI0030A9D309
MGETARSGGFGRGGEDIVRARMVFNGSFCGSFATFVADKAERLSLSVSIDCSDHQAIITATGPSALVGALEMAACIAPEDCVVTDWVTTETKIGS